MCSHHNMLQEAVMSDPSGEARDKRVNLTGYPRTFALLVERATIFAAFVFIVMILSGYLHMSR